METRVQLLAFIQLTLLTLSPWQAFKKAYLQKHLIENICDWNLFENVKMI